MKKYLFVLVAISCCSILNAQEVVLKGSKEITAKLTPQQVIDSLHKKFPNATAVKYYQTSEASKNGWLVTEEVTPTNPSEDITSYTISFKQNNWQYYGLYDESGHLLKYKYQESVDQVPDAVKNAAMNLKNQYPGYKATAKTYFKTQDYSKSNEYYEVTASNGSTIKRFYFDPQGNVVKVKD